MSNINCHLARIKVFAYGNKVLDQKVDLCANNVTELCPVQKGLIKAAGQHEVPSKYTNSITQAAYFVPDIEGTVQIDIFDADSPGHTLGCFMSQIENGKSTKVEAVTYFTIAFAGVALAVSAGSSAASANSGSSSSTTPPGNVGLEHGVGNTSLVSGPGTNVASGGWHPPGFVDFFSVLQHIAISGMYNLNYPSAYRNFSQNMGWSTGVLTWPGMQKSIDKFREQTGGNMTASAYDRLEETTLVYRNSQNMNNTDMEFASQAKIGSYFMKRVLRPIMDALEPDLPITTPPLDENPTGQKKYVSIVTGIKAYVEKLSVPNTNTFMTLLIWWAIIVGVCITVILLVKLILEIWSLKGNLGDKFSSFRQQYWVILGSTLVRLIVIFYGVWVLYCFYQFKIGDSWGTRLLAGITFGILTFVLVTFTLRIIWIAHVASRQKGGLEYLFEHKPWIRRYGLFYDQFKVKYWWCFIPMLLAVFGRNAFVTLGSNNGLVQVIGQLVIDVSLTILLIVLMPFNTKMGNGINIAIQVVRVISLVLLLTFAVQLNLANMVTTGIGMALIVIQSVLTILLVVLICMNACFGIYKWFCNYLHGKNNATTSDEKPGVHEQVPESPELRAQTQSSTQDKSPDEKHGYFTNFLETASNGATTSSGTSPPLTPDGSPHATVTIRNNFGNPRSIQSSLHAAPAIPTASAARNSFDPSTRTSYASSSSATTTDADYLSALGSTRRGSSDSDNSTDSLFVSSVVAVPSANPDRRSTFSRNFSRPNSGISTKSGGSGSWSQSRNATRSVPRPETETETAVKVEAIQQQSAAGVFDQLNQNSNSELRSRPTSTATQISTSGMNSDNEEQQYTVDWSVPNKSEASLAKTIKAKSSFT